MVVILQLGTLYIKMKKILIFTILGMFLISLAYASLISTTLTKEVEVSKENLTILTTAKVQNYTIFEKDFEDKVYLSFRVKGKIPYSKVINKTKTTCIKIIDKDTDKLIKTCTYSAKTLTEINNEKLAIEKDFLNKLIEEQKLRESKLLEAESKTILNSITEVTLKEEKSIIKEIFG